MSMIPADRFHTLTNTSISAIVICAIVISAFSAFFRVNGKDEAQTRWASVTNAWRFFSRRFDFLQEKFSKISGSLYRFKVLQYSVVAVRGGEARKAFFDDKNLNFMEGYKILRGASPDLENISEDMKTERNVTDFNKRLAILANRDRLSDILPALMDDMNKQMLRWGKDGRLDPFKDIYDLVFQMTVRVASCDELATNQKDMRLLRKCYWDLEKSATPSALLLPWFPSPGKIKNKIAIVRLYFKLKKYVNMRNAATTPSADAIDIMLGMGDKEQDIITYVLAVIFAGVINTGINSCWALLYLACNPEWRAKVQAEIDGLIARHTDTTFTEPLHKRLSAIPIAVWEDQMPVVDLVIRETIRLTFNATLFRRNVNDQTQIDGHKIAKGEFIAYSVYDAHMNPAFYDHPEVFDPYRYGPGREEDKKSTYAFVGWGAGRHPCTGVKMAKLEIKALLALFLAGYEYSVVDSSGNYPKSPPKPDYNDIHSARPLGEQCYFQFKRKMD